MEWTRGPVIGRGSTATVHLATTVTGDRFAVKSSHLSTSLQNEILILSQLNSPYIISYKGYNISSNNNIPMYNIYMEYAPRGTISDIIKQHGGSLDESLIRLYTRQILLGLNHLHANNIVHCDIKCDNILVCDNDVVKIGDFGCAKLMGQNATLAFSGTPVYMAPELVRNEEQSFSADVWAVGCVVFEMVTGFNPWVNVDDPVSALYKIGFSDELPELPRWVSLEVKDFLKLCWQRDVRERCEVKELLKHPFVVNFDMSFEKLDEFAKNSPTSVLDQDFWGCIEVVKNSPGTMQMVEFSGENSLERLRQLVKDNLLCLPDWVDEEDWITIRSSHIEERCSRWE